MTAESVRALISSLNLPERVKSDALAVYALLAGAEAEVHGVDAETVHLHEVGALDAVADIVGCCLLVHMLGVDRVSASPIHVGAGALRCAHGVLPVPAPATAHILLGAPIYGGALRGELCTPTGAALLRHFAERFGDMEVMTVSKIGYGMGSKDFEHVNCLRAFLYEPADGARGERDEVFEITCNLDDMTPEAIGAASECILDGGALDVFVTPVYMKKNRPAAMLTCLCRTDDREAVTDAIFQHTTTAGVRFKLCGRDKLKYTFETVSTPYGDVRIKTASGRGVTRSKPEYDDVARAAREHAAPFGEVHDAAARSAKNGARGEGR
jgi:uncharacterized protein (TIGR00299 family) protein